jgi:acetylornithine aminotransferase
VTTGIGRTGLWFGYQHYGLAPDVVALGKGIGNGYPVSVTALASGVIERLDGDPLKYAQSHQNDPLGAAIVREVVRVITDEGLIERGRGIAAVLSSGLEEIKDRTGRITDIRSRGLMIALELHDSAFAVRVHHKLARRGYILARRPGLNVLRLDPSLTIDQQDIEGFLQTFEAVLIETGRDDHGGEL